jgi:hypothetical protein
MELPCCVLLVCGVCSAATRGQRGTEFTQAHTFSSYIAAEIRAKQYCGVEIHLGSVKSANQFILALADEFLPLFLFVCDLKQCEHVCRGSVGLCDNAAVRYQSLHVGNQIGRCVSPFVSGILVRWHRGPTGMWHDSFLAVVSLFYVFKSCLRVRGTASLERLLPLLTCSPLGCVCRKKN